MSDARWLEIDADFSAAEGHFARAVALFEEGGFQEPGLTGYRAQMAFLHAMQSAHTSLESGLVRILEMVGEEPPSGERWHADLIRRAAMDRPGIRPPILRPDLVRAADETRRFRNVATRAYDSFEAAAATGAVEAARVLAREVKTSLAALRSALDPDG